MNKISFDVTPDEALVIGKIVSRYLKLVKRHGQDEELQSRMDITACHANGCRLRLAELLVANDFNFMHDCVGIERHLCRQTGALKGLYRPRFSERCSDGALA
ncbi:hypothetical protein Gbth_017_148 [Gluconobacter thailandicus F149-1 = NBRC 100600]|uniref:DUF6874 domain-containing protein n=1 Tax=Gluconobacter thailandicus NBRC 3257 TaxID=1381097 RepID=A0ABQ0IW42_GLUTH|nr:hypothetical protein [Gluconobacter thailandicus]KXV54172.1 hypothetical protein AD946_04370 [Gluconobacter thailandicus]GAD26436.1 hypothetical protein NBRC3257_1435 [Gluconobacter thailandicus NBRC 3257]GAN92973.1 hypothetical protein Gbth_017_148 [Gluconobacter thailandicus F149-1 = NBRC 100600]GBR61585.1 hypothetical protein AA100600_2923 [Gluconobacter thailandicus F149-1 = NBRC 100600]GEL87478.1 hypothetical protein GTH01_18360 [Gluconobacter thailandicus F149-1 = NBRC 100600]